ncbi:hypothetical protein GCM10011581_19280 [Saccharopolyspora subtropica]|uniref:Uncharacterized protein n=1 Tax=Saccharopolyspora thermophila TaxID=89367 RepID=A0A917N9Z4_9PSEU|nr:hypothetical protein [Saccharopolyspora subtropica]GGI81950.1 hypothetical protein GCM10011581_19280 [Saccharopolyspora subtropica]
MSCRAILRWPNGSPWGHLATVGHDGGLPRFAGFVRMDDPRVRALLDRVSVRHVDGDMLEVHFTTESELPTVHDRAPRPAHGRTGRPSPTRT